MTGEGVDGDLSEVFRQLLHKPEPVGEAGNGQEPLDDPGHELVAAEQGLVPLGLPEHILHENGLLLVGVLCSAPSRVAAVAVGTETSAKSVQDPDEVVVRVLFNLTAPSEPPALAKLPGLLQERLRPLPVPAPADHWSAAVRSALHVSPNFRLHWFFNLDGNG